MVYDDGCKLYVCTDNLGFMNLNSKQYQKLKKNYIKELVQILVLLINQ